MKNQKENMGVIVSLVIVVCAVGLVFFIVMNKGNKGNNSNLDQNKILEIQDKSQVSSDNEPLKEQVNPTENKMEQNTKILKDFTPVSKTTTLEKIDLVVGSGKEVKVGDTVSVHYTGAVAATGVIFQSSKDFGPTPVTFPLSQVIKGWTDGIPGMKIGGTRRLIIPADQAYGATPPPGSGIPANADLVFDVELIAIK